LASLLSHRSKPVGIGLVVFFTGLTALRLFTSSDPVSINIWGKEEVFGESVYQLHRHLSGNDGLTYNLQYLLIARKRTALIKKAHYQKRSVLSPQCQWVFPDPRNDFQTLKILQLSGINLNKPCIGND
jgi:hypothetical protein